jgi:hypothetical protein
MSEARARIRQLLAEIETLEPIAEEEEQREALVLALEEERHAVEVSRSIALSRGEQRLSDDPLSSDFRKTGQEAAGELAMRIAEIDERLSAA